MQLRNVSVIFNPKGGSAKGRTLETLVSSLVAAGVHVTTTPTTPERDSAKTLAKMAATNGADLVVAFGGDGTVRQVAEGLMGTNVAMAVFPGGTGNLFAQNFYAPPRPADFVRMLLDGEPQSIDLFRYDCRTAEGREESGIFMVGLGFGPLSDAISDASPGWKRVFGRLVYAFNVAKAACWPRSVMAQFCVPGTGNRIEGPVAAAFALNVVPHTVPFLSRGCTPCDGLMDVVVVKGRWFHQILGCGACLTAMRPERSKHYARIRAATVNVATARPITLNVDGDPGPTTQEFTLSVLPGGARIILA